jgi:hypothetical protein
LRIERGGSPSFFLIPISDKVLLNPKSKKDFSSKIQIFLPNVKKKFQLNSVTTVRVPISDKVLLNLKSKKDFSSKIRNKIPKVKKKFQLNSVTTVKGGISDKILLNLFYAILSVGLDIVLRIAYIANAAQTVFNAATARHGALAADTAKSGPSAIRQKKRRRLPPLMIAVIISFDALR